MRVRVRAIEYEYSESREQVRVLFWKKNSSWFSRKFALIGYIFFYRDLCSGVKSRKKSNQLQVAYCY